MISGYDGLETSTYHYDAIGSADALLDESETATDRYEHRAFGLQQWHTGSSDNPFTFVGRQGYYRDEELALYLAGARYYDPAAGRWLSEDPIRLAGGDPNLYRYVKNNPVNATDPSGLVEFGFLPDPLAHTSVHGSGYKFGSTDIELAMEALQLAALHRELEKALKELAPKEHTAREYDATGYRSPWIIIGLLDIWEHNRKVDESRGILATLQEIRAQLADIEEVFSQAPLSTVDFHSPVKVANRLFSGQHSEEPSQPLGVGLNGARAALESGYQIGFADGPLEDSNFSPIEITFLGGRLLFSATRSIAKTLVVRRTVVNGEELAVAMRRQLDNPPPPAVKPGDAGAATGPASRKLDAPARASDNAPAPASQPARPTADGASAAMGKAAAPKGVPVDADVVTSQCEFIRYGALDELGRPTQMQARITQDVIGTGSPANRSIQPPGFLTGARGANRARGHLLGDQLGGSGRETRNLVTLEQNATNSPVMRDFETAVRQAVKGGQIVDYTVTPLYNFTGRIPRGVTLRARGSGGFQLDVTILNSPGMKR